MIEQASKNSNSPLDGFFGKSRKRNLQSPLRKRGNTYIMLLKKAQLDHYGGFIC